MSYVRFSTIGSDVYVYQDIDFGLRCCGCLLCGGGLGNFGTRSRASMLAHLAEHRAAGHGVPDYVDDVLREEIVEVGDDCPGEMHRAMDRRAGKEAS